MEKKQKVIPAICTALFIILFMQQYLQSRSLNLLFKESQYGDEYHQNTDREMRVELKGIKETLGQIAYNQQGNFAPSDLRAANNTVERTKDLPLLISSAIFRDGRLSLRFGEELKESDSIFGISLRNGRAISNHSMKTAPSYNGELPHPLADQFILVLYRSETFERDGQRLSGVHPIMRWSTKLTPIDKQ